MMNGDEGGQLSDLIGGDTVLMRGDIRLIGGDPPQSPPTRENPADSLKMLKQLILTAMLRLSLGKITIFLMETVFMKIIV